MKLGMVPRESDDGDKGYPGGPHRLSVDSDITLDYHHLLLLVPSTLRFVILSCFFLSVQHVSESREG
jgi:hypothetical protein